MDRSSDWLGQGRGELAAARDLHEFYIPTRYPDAFPSGTPVEQFFDADARAALADAEEVIQFVGATLGSP